MTSILFRAKFQDGRTFQILHSFLRNTWFAYGYLEFHVTYVGILMWLIICCYLYGRNSAQLSLSINFFIQCIICIKTNVNLCHYVPPGVALVVIPHTFSEGECVLHCQTYNVAVNMCGYDAEDDECRLYNVFTYYSITRTTQHTTFIVDITIGTREYKFNSIFIFCDYILHFSY